MIALFWPYVIAAICWLVGSAVFTGILVGQEELSDIFEVCAFIGVVGVLGGIVWPISAGFVIGLFLQQLAKARRALNKS